MPELTAQDVARTTPEELSRLMAGPPEALAPWMRAAAKAGLLEAQAIYGQMLLDGTGVALDQVEALQWFKRAAQADHLMSINMVGRCYENGWGTPADSVVAAYWFRIAAERGLDWGLYNYAHQFAAGRGGVQKDMARAYALYRQAADMGHIKSIGVVGRFHEDGEIVAQDVDQAFECYQRAAEGGDFRGMFHYARLLHVRGHTQEAFEWFARVPAAATPAFMREARKMLLETGDPDLASVYPDSPNA